MMVNLLLCKSGLFQNTATAVVDILGGVGESFMSSCAPTRALPHLILHGQNDPIITFYTDNIVDSSKFVSTRKDRLGHGAPRNTKREILMLCIACNACTHSLCPVLPCSQNG